jgi:DNA-binding HxlR family transcriptional regulator
MDKKVTVRRPCGSLTSMACWMKIEFMTRPERRRTCPVTQFQRMISGKYKLRILWDLRDRPLRYGQIKKGLLRGLLGSPQISARVLSRELKSLTDIGMVMRKDFRVMPPKVTYSLTSKGKSLIPTISRMHTWGAKHLRDSV